MNICEQQITTGISVNPALTESARAKVRDDTREGSEGGSENMAPMRHRWHGQDRAHKKCSMGRKKEVTLHT